MNLAEYDSAEEAIEEEFKKTPDKLSIMKELTSRIMAHHKKAKRGGISSEEANMVKVASWTALLTQLSQHESVAIALIESLPPDESLNFEDSIEFLLLLTQ